MATIKQIAQMAGVSRGTVDRVLNNRGIVNEQTAEKVLAIAKSLQYKPSKAARSLAARKLNIRFVYILFDPSANPFFSQVEQGIQKKAKELAEYGVQVDILYSDFSNPQSQIALLEKAVKSKANGIVIAGFNTQQVADKIQQITNSGIPVITANTDILHCGRLAYVGSNYYKSGQTAAGLMRLLTQGKANIAVLVGSHEILCHAQRLEGFANHLQNNCKQMQIATVQENHDDDFESFTKTQAILQQNPAIDALFLASGGVYGACRAIKSLSPHQRKPIVICYDNPPQTCEMLQQDIIAATICQQPEKQGAKPLDILFNMVAMNNTPKQKNYYTEIEIVIKEVL